MSSRSSPSTQRRSDLTRQCDNDDRRWYRRFNNIVSYEFIWIRRKCEYIWFNVHYCVLFSSRVRVRLRVSIRFSVWLVSCYAHVFVRLQVVIVTDRPDREQTAQGTGRVSSPAPPVLLSSNTLLWWIPLLYISYWTPDSRPPVWSPSIVLRNCGCSCTHSMLLPLPSMLKCAPAA